VQRLGPLALYSLAVTLLHNGSRVRRGVPRDWGWVDLRTDEQLAPFFLGVNLDDLPAIWRRRDGVLATAPALRFGRITMQQLDLLLPFGEVLFMNAIDYDGVVSRPVAGPPGAGVQPAPLTSAIAMPESAPPASALAPPARPSVYPGSGHTEPSPSASGSALLARVDRAIHLLQELRAEVLCALPRDAPVVRGCIVRSRSL
jgi:hypothetical protein